MKSDLEIAREVKLKPISEIAGKIGIREDELIPWGRYKAKVSLDIFNRINAREDGKLILVTTINPTSEGEGKTTVTIGLAQALAKLGKKVALAIREPSLGPTMGVKGGGTGGGYSQVLPMEDINLHFTGDMSAVTSAHNLLSALLDNHIYHGDRFHIDPRYIVWPRVMDMNDRNLRNIVVGLGGPVNGTPREDRFSITAASEVMAILCLSKDMNELKERLSRIIAAYTYEEKPVTASDLNAVGAMALLLNDALKPNIVQTVEHVPAFVHGGPFANIAHGTNSLIATRMGLKLADYFVTEAGFGSDLGAEKFFDIVCRHGIKPNVAVLVVSIRALKIHGGMSQNEARAGKAGEKEIKKGLKNMEKHLENLALFGVPVVVAINRFPNDRNEEIEVVEKFCNEKNVAVAVSEVWSEGGEGGIELAGKVVDTIHNRKPNFRYLYSPDMGIKEKIETIARKIYGAGKIVYTVAAEDDIRIINKMDMEDLLVCMAKTPYSLSDDPQLKGRPENFKITIKQIRISAGAGFIVPITGKITTMPGLPAHPAAEKMDIVNGKAEGLF
ncbi:MAG: formate--tetrahydrofolate ligase [Thermoplasmata archaeon]|jgi:formate--tetrahydrofolate ligase|nr:MAG: formate--tetrahydrofolate ligase [Thermoplasmata archaeon]